MFVLKSVCDQTYVMYVRMTYVCMYVGIRMYERMYVHKHVAK